MVKKIFITIFITLIIGFIIYADYKDNSSYTKSTEIYQVYLDNEIIGYIDDDQELYNLINEKQNEIKNKYKIENVYPPENLQVVRTNKFDVNISSAESIYNKMAELDSFTIEGYKINFKSETNDLTIFVLDKSIFEESLKQFVFSFISEEDYNNYINDTQPEIKNTGKIYESIYFDETITIKKDLISAKEKIYNDSQELTQFLLFGPSAKIKSYTIKAGDTIESISEDNQLNIQEFLIANTNYNSPDNLLTIGDKVNTTLINPMITLSYDVHEVSDTTISYDKKIIYDDSKSSSYSEITTAGVNGITRITEEYKVKNGETQSGVVITNKEVIIEKVDQVTTRGQKSWGNGSGSYVDDGTEWGWPTNQPFVITSRYAWRWGKIHEAIDISGTGKGSPIYAARDGVVVIAGNSNASSGWHIIIQHDNGYYTNYAHMIANSLTVKVGDHVSKGQIIGRMGETGFATGTHLHFGIWQGYPNRTGSKSYNPCLFYRNKCK